MHPIPQDWLNSATLRDWVCRQTNSALRDEAAWRLAQSMLSAAGLPVHNDAPKNWDTFLALFHASSSLRDSDAVLDAGAERYSAFLPALRSLGYVNLTGVNLTFPCSEEIGGIRYQGGDITRTAFPDGSLAFIACLSVIEHGVDTEKFLTESARILAEGGRLFVSFDYWETPVETRGQQAYGGPIRIFTRRDVDDLLAQAEHCGLHLDSVPDFSCQDRVVHWRRFDLRYTFANLLLAKRPGRHLPSPPTGFSRHPNAEGGG